MSSVLYYSNYCDACKKYITILSKSSVKDGIHFICIDKRVKENNKTFILLENGQKILLPSNVTRVPALLLLTEGYKVLYGEQILNHLRPQQEASVRVATQNNMEPTAYSFSSSGGGVMSDTYSFWDQPDEELKTTGSGGMRQMHNYVDVNTAFSGNISEHVMQPASETTLRGTNKMSEDAASQEMEERIRKLKEQRDADINAIKQNRPMMY
jgi:hypothetical protein